MDDQQRIKNGSVRSRIVLSGVLLSLAGCASHYQLSPEAAYAEVMVTSTNDSTRTLLRDSDVLIFSPECQLIGNSPVMATQGGNDESHVFPVLRVPVGQAIALTLAYRDARLGENRACATTLIFTPQSHHRYTLTHTVSNQVRQCRADMVDDTTAAQPSYALADYSCSMQGKTAAGTNSKPIRHRMKMENGVAIAVKDENW